MANEINVGSVFAFENICGGGDASGGGCGGPLGVSRVSKEAFDAARGRTEGELSEHNDSEVSSEIVRAQKEGALFVKCMYRACSSCR